jgi:hypothetical protein
MEEDVSALIQRQGGDFEFAVDHSELNDLLQQCCHCMHVSRSQSRASWIQLLKISMLISRAILSALKSPPHGLKTITDPNDPFCPPG